MLEINHLELFWTYMIVNYPGIMSEIIGICKSAHFLPVLCTMRTSENRSGPLSTCTGNPCQCTGTSSPVSTGDLPALSMQVLNRPLTSSLLYVNQIQNNRCENFRGQSSVVVTRLPCNDKDVGSKPAATRNEKTDIMRPPYRR